jgi:hypothetical protein
MRAKGGGGGRPRGFYRGRGVGCLLCDWLRWVAAHLFIRLGGRQGLWRKKVSRKGWPKFLPWSAPS